MRLGISGYDWSVELTRKEWDALQALDYLDVVCPRLEKEGASKIEYNAHFGCFIFFHTERVDEANACLDAIKTLLR